MDPPQAPENVRLVDPLGNEWPCLVTYDGFVNGVHRWRATPLHTTAEVTGGWLVRIGMLPERTELALPFEEGGENPS